MKKVIMLSEDEYNDLLLCVHHILSDLQYLPDGFHRTEIKHQAEEIEKILDGET